MPSTIGKVYYPVRYLRKIIDIRRIPQGIPLSVYYHPDENECITKEKPGEYRFLIYCCNSQLQYVRKITVELFLRIWYNSGVDYTILGGNNYAYHGARAGIAEHHDHGGTPFLSCTQKML